MCVPFYLPLDRWWIEELTTTQTVLETLSDSPSACEKTDSIGAYDGVLCSNSIMKKMSFTANDLRMLKAAGVVLQ